MPLYEYECDKCREVFDELRKFDERKDPIQCPKCGGEGRVVISGFAQGSGGSSGGRGGCNPGST